MRVRRRRLLFVALGPATGAAVVLGGACGGEGVNAVGPDALVEAFADAPASADAGVMRFDARPDGPDAWKCVQLDDGGNYVFVPVECPDADFYITVNGDGPPQTFRSNHWGDGYYSELAPEGGYHVPVTQTQRPPDNYPPQRFIWGGDTEDFHNKRIELTITPYWSDICYSRTNSIDWAYCSSQTDAAPDVTFTRYDPPGGIVAGTYSALVDRFYPPDSGPLFLSGTFQTCHICPVPPQPGD